MKTVTERNRATGGMRTRRTPETKADVLALMQERESALRADLSALHDEIARIEADPDYVVPDLAPTPDHLRTFAHYARQKRETMRA